MRTQLRLALALALALAVAAGCAGTHRRPAGVPVESRPTPPQPDETTAKDSAASAVPRTPPRAPADRAPQVSHLVSDTTLVHDTLERCRGRKLLPDQEGVYDATVKALVDTRAALGIGDLSRAQSLARQARSLASSLDCR